MHLNLESTPSELRHYICGQEVGITSRDIYLHVADMKQAVEDILEFVHVLYFVQKDEILPGIGDAGLHIVHHCIGIT